MKKILTLALAMSLGGSLAQDAFVYPDAWTANPNTKKKTGGEVRDSALSDYKTLNPFTTSEAGNAPATMARGASLFGLDPRNDKWIPIMASSMPKISNGDKTFVVKLRKGMKFSDGKEITANDFISTMKIHKDEKVGSNSRDYFFIRNKEIKLSKVDKYTLKFTFPYVSATAYSQMSFTPWPEHVFGPVYAKSGAAGIKKMWSLKTPPKKLVSPGAWVLSSLKPGERAIFKKNKYFGQWNKDPRGVSLPYVDTYSVRIVKDQNASLAAYLAGQIDVIGVRNADDLSQIKKAMTNKSLNATLLPNVSSQASSDFISFNWNRSTDPTKQALFRDVRFRRAMSHIMNREAIVKLVMGGLGSPSYFSIPPLMKKWVFSTSPKYKYDPKKASKLLAELGYKKKNSKGYLVNSKGKELEFSLITNSGNTRREQVGNIIRDEAKKIGVKVIFTPMDFNTMVSQLLEKGKSRKFDAALISITAGDLDWPFGDNQIPCVGNLHLYNKSGKCITKAETQMEKLFFQGQSTLNDAKRLKIGQQLQKIEGDQQNVIYISSGNYHVTFNNRLLGNYPKKLMNSYYGSRDWNLTWVR